MKIVRVVFGITQECVAENILINRATYTYYELAKTEPSYDVLKSIIDFYNYKVNIEPKLSFDDLLSKDLSIDNFIKVIN